MTKPAVAVLCFGLGAVFVEVVLPVVVTVVYERVYLPRIAGEE